MLFKLPPYQIPINLRVCKTLWHTDQLLGNDCKKKKMRQRLLLGSSPHATMEVELEAVFSMWSALQLYHATDQVQLVQRREVKSWLVS
jgi:hypothetical protein